MGAGLAICEDRIPVKFCKIGAAAPFEEPKEGFHAEPYLSVRCPCHCFRDGIHEFPDCRLESLAERMVFAQPPPVNGAACLVLQEYRDGTVAVAGIPRAGFGWFT